MNVLGRGHRGMRGVMRGRGAGRGFCPSGGPCEDSGSGMPGRGGGPSSVLTQTPRHMFS